MPCKKSELVEAINTLISASTTANKKLLEFSASELQACIETLTFGEEETPVSETEVVN